MTANRPLVSTAIITALNYHAISCLHVNAGECRPCDVSVGDHEPPAHHRVRELLNAFVNEVNRYRDSTDPVTLAAYCLWRLNHIHPFINGNAGALLLRRVRQGRRLARRRSDTARIAAAEPR